MGWDPDGIATTSDRQRGVFVRIPGIDLTASALLIYGHHNVLPAMAEDWIHPPFAAEVDDGSIWGRGAVDKKDMDAMIMTVVRQSC